MAIKTIVRSFLLLDGLETSSKGPGCLNIDMKRAKIAIGIKPWMIKRRTDTIVSTLLALSPTMDRATCPPSSIAAGNKLSMVTIIPTQPANATGCNRI
ncbi:MAG: hypothetical protein PVH12_07990 [Candidatus Bathyarchaeota archaeon]|jgi:hypothetical protein